MRDASGNFSAGTITAALLSGDIQLQASKTISFEGSTDDAYETVLSVVDPTADRTILLPNVSGTIITTGDSGTVTNTMLTGSIANSKLANSSITIDGVSVSLGGTLSILDADNSWVGTQTFPDSKLVLKDNLDATKVASFQLSNITPGATRSMIIPDETGVIATRGYVDTELSALGTMSTQDSDSVTITGGTISATFTGNVTGNVSGSSGSCTGNSVTATTATNAVNVIGVGQTWQNVAGSRSSGTNYTNSTGKPIMVSITSIGTARITVGGVVAAQSGINNATSQICVIVPNGTTYSLNAGAPIGLWAELR